MQWKKSDDIRIKYASKYAQSSNYWKNSIGMNQAVKELKVIEKKTSFGAPVARMDPSGT